MTNEPDRTLDTLIAAEGLPDFIIDVDNKVWERPGFCLTGYAPSQPLDLLPNRSQWKRGPDELLATLYAYRNGETRIEVVEGIEVIFGVGGVSASDLPNLVTVERIRTCRPDLIVDETGNVLDLATDPDDLPCSTSVIYREGFPSVDYVDGLRIIRGYGDASADQLDAVVALIRAGIANPNTAAERAAAAVLRIHRSNAGGSCVCCSTAYPCPTIRAIHAEVGSCSD